jgi:hypothetical protein
MAYPTVRDFPASNLAGFLDIRILPLVADRDPFRQLEYIRKYVEELKCSAVLVEDEYIDRDYMQDHSAFYAASFAKYKSSCHRVHFFAGVPAAKILSELQAVAAEALNGRAAFEAACRKFSAEKYLGFMVVKPLPGSPVGRTVLRTFDRDAAGKDYIRRFDATREYTTHLLGVELIVRGLGFQQQDQGVSACATTAIWSSLQKLRDFEDVAAATPAQITAGASRFALPFGRSLPSEGLSIDQMCQGIHALGISPNLVRLLPNRFARARSIIHAAAISEIAPILIIQNASNGDRHAVAAAGVKLRRKHEPTLVAANAIDDMAGDVIGVYIHDDRLGPYIRTRFEERKVGHEQHPCVIIEEGGNDVLWVITHLLMPVHGKIRTAIAQMLRFSTKFGGFAYAALGAIGIKPAPIRVSTRIVRAHRYVEELLQDKTSIREDRLSRFFSEISLSRYVGVTSMAVPEIGDIDALVDTTGTERNANCLAVVARAEPDARSQDFVFSFAKKFDCSAVA